MSSVDGVKDLGISVDLARELCRLGGHCKYLGQKCNTSRCAITENPECPAVRDRMFKVYLAGWRAGREAAALVARNNNLAISIGLYIAKKIRALPEPSQEDER